MRRLLLLKGILMPHIQEATSFVRRHKTGLLLLAGAGVGVYAGITFHAAYINHTLPDGAIKLGQKYFIPTNPSFVEGVQRAIREQGLI